MRSASHELPRRDASKDRKVLRKKSLGFLFCAAAFLEDGLVDSCETCETVESRPRLPKGCKHSNGDISAGPAVWQALGLSASISFALVSPQGLRHPGGDISAKLAERSKEEASLSIVLAVVGASDSAPQKDSDRTKDHSLTMGTSSVYPRSRIARLPLRGRPSTISGGDVESTLATFGIRSVTSTTCPPRAPRGTRSSKTSPGAHGCGTWTKDLGAPRGTLKRTLTMSSPGSLPLMAGEPQAEWHSPSRMALFSRLGTRDCWMEPKLA